MSTIQRVNFENVSDILPVQRRDFPLADTSLAQPLNALAVVDGEWMTLNASYQLLRATNIAAIGNVATLMSFPLWVERGRYDTQGIAGTRFTVLYLGAYEFDTRVFDASVAVGGGVVITTVMQPLKVATIGIGGRNYSGLVGHGGAADAAPVRGYVTRLPAANGGKLRFISGGRA